MTDWCYEFDFRYEEGDWTYGQLAYGETGNAARYIPGAGWLAVCHPYYAPDLIAFIRRPFTATITKIHATCSVEGLLPVENFIRFCNGVFASNEEQDNSPGTTLAQLDTVAGTQEYHWSNTSGVSVTGLSLMLYGGYGVNGCDPDLLIRIVQIEGTGANPFACIFDDFVTNFYRAPITGNPSEGTLPDSGFKFAIDRQFTDNKNQKWYRVCSVFVDNDPCTNLNSDVADAKSAGKGGVWIHAPEDSPIDETSCTNLPIATEFTIPTIAWDDFDGTFAGWPIDIANMCDSENTVREIHSLGIQPPDVHYACNDTHNGVDFFIPDDEENIPAKSIGTGIVVGIGIGDDADTHAYWGAANLSVGDGSGYSVIVRYGHLYVLYGHLNSIDDNIWVGCQVTTGMQLGTIGKFNSRHLHVEVHSFGEFISDSLDSEFVSAIDQTGILPIGVSEGSEGIADYHYDIMQFLPDPPGYSTQDNDGFHVKELVATSRLQISGEEGQATIDFGTDCTFTYKTFDPSQSSTIEEINGYRGFVGYVCRAGLKSPLTQTQTPGGS